MIGVPLLGTMSKKPPLILLSFHQGAAVFVLFLSRKQSFAGAVREPLSVGLVRVDP